MVLGRIHEPARYVGVCRGARGLRRTFNSARWKPGIHAVKKEGHLKGEEPLGQLVEARHRVEMHQLVHSFDGVEPELEDPLQ